MRLALFFLLLGQTFGIINEVESGRSIFGCFYRGLMSIVTGHCE